MKIIVNKKIALKCYVFITIFAIILGLISLYIGIKNILEINILNISKTNMAQVISYSRDYDISNRNNGNTTLWVRYTYNVDGIPYTGEGNIWWKDSYQNEETIKIYYRKNNPQKSYIYHTSYYFIILSILLIILIPIVLYKRIKN